MASDDLYFEVLSALTGRWDEDDALAARAALRAVVELHEPCTFLRRPLAAPICETCSGDDDLHDEPWPCSTIRTIAEALGVTEGDQ